MILPTTYAVALALLIVSMICWGSWANTFKLAKGWRFELFYFDYAFGVFLAAVIAAFTFGSVGDGLTFMDNLSVAAKRYMAYAFLAGCIFNLANMLLVAAISLTGLAVAFPVGIGLAMVIGVVWNFILEPAGNPLLLFGGAALVVLAILADALAYRAHGRMSGATVRGFSLKGLIISLISGVLMGSFYPLVQTSMDPEIGLGPYSVGPLFGLGVVLSTLVMNFYFMNLPVQGEPLPITAYLRGSVRNHALGLAGGALWCTGAITNFVAAGSPDAGVGPAVSYALGQGATLISALWGLLVWKEFAGATGQVRMLLAVMLVLFAAGLGMVSIAPLFV
jgi:glucose uptake protein